MSKDTEVRVTQIPLKDLKDSPFNPRKHYVEGELRELAGSIKDNGVLQPILARPLLDAAGFEIVYGHRRAKASSLAGLTTVPAMIKALTDEQAMEAQIIENMDRSDVTPMEEARGFEAYRILRNVGVAELAEKFKRHPSHVARRLSLLKLTDKGIALLEKEKLPLTAALELCRLDPKIQTEVLNDLEGYGLESNSASEIIDTIRGHAHEDLKRAPWKLDDAKLDPKAGACDVCPFFSGSNPDLFGDLGKTTCTKPACYKNKEKLNEERLVREAEAKGMRTLRGPKAQSVISDYGSHDYVKPSAKCEEDPKGRHYQALLGKSAEELEVVLAITGPGKGQSAKCWKKADVDRLLKEKGYDFVKLAHKQKTKKKMSKEQEEQIERVEEMTTGDFVRKAAEKIAKTITVGKNSTFPTLLRRALEFMEGYGWGGGIANAFPEWGAQQKKTDGNGWQEYSAEKLEAAFKKATVSDLIACMAIYLFRDQNEEAILKELGVDQAALKAEIKRRLKAEDDAHDEEVRKQLLKKAEAELKLKAKTEPPLSPAARAVKKEAKAAKKKGKK